MKRFPLWPAAVLLAVLVASVSAFGQSTDKDPFVLRYDDRTQKLTWSFGDEARNTIQQSVQDSNALLQARKAELQRWNKTDQDKFYATYGTRDRADSKVVLEAVDKVLILQRKISAGELEDVFKPGKGNNDPEVVAYVLPDNRQFVFLKKEFFGRLSDEGTPEKERLRRADILAHELAHLEEVGFDDRYDDLTKLPTKDKLRNAVYFGVYLERAGLPDAPLPSPNKSRREDKQGSSYKAREEFPANGNSGSRSPVGSDSTSPDLQGDGRGGEGESREASKKSFEGAYKPPTDTKAPIQQKDTPADKAKEKPDVAPKDPRKGDGIFWVSFYRKGSKAGELYGGFKTVEEAMKAVARLRKWAATIEPGDWQVERIEIEYDGPDGHVKHTITLPTKNKKPEPPQAPPDEKRLYFDESAKRSEPPDPTPPVGGGLPPVRRPPTVVSPPPVGPSPSVTPPPDANRQDETRSGGSDSDGGRQRFGVYQPYPGGVNSGREYDSKGNRVDDSGLTVKERPKPPDGGGTPAPSARIVFKVYDPNDPKDKRLSPEEVARIRAKVADGTYSQDDQGRIFSDPSRPRSSSGAGGAGDDSAGAGNSNKNIVNGSTPDNKNRINPTDPNSPTPTPAPAGGGPRVRPKRTGPNSSSTPPALPVEGNGKPQQAGPKPPTQAPARGQGRIGQSQPYPGGRNTQQSYDSEGNRTGGGPQRPRVNDVPGEGRRNGTVPNPVVPPTPEARRGPAPANSPSRDGTEGGAVRRSDTGSNSTVRNNPAPAQRPAPRPPETNGQDSKSGRMTMRTPQKPADSARPGAAVPAPKPPTARNSAPQGSAAPAAPPVKPPAARNSSPQVSAKPAPPAKPPAPVAQRSPGGWNQNPARQGGGSRCPICGKADCPVWRRQQNVLP